MSSPYKPMAPGLLPCSWELAMGQALGPAEDYTWCELGLPVWECRVLFWNFRFTAALLLSARHHNGPRLTLTGGCWEESWEPVCEIDIWLFRSLEASGWILVKGSEQRSLAEGQSSPWGVPVWPWSALLWVSGTPMASGSDLGLQLGPPGRSPLHFTLTPCTLACCQRVSFPVAGN